jgi:fumarate reductase subunit C
LFILEWWVEAPLLERYLFLYEASFTPIVRFFLMYMYALIHLKCKLSVFV